MEGRVMIRYLMIPFVIFLIIAIYKIITQMLLSLRVSREKTRREAEHIEYMTTYNTRRQLYGEVYNTSKKYKLSGNENTELQENISNCSEDDEVEIAFDSSRQRYAVSCGAETIGYLPQQAGDTLGKIADKKAIITEIGIASNSKYYAQITAYYNE